MGEKQRLRARIESLTIAHDEMQRHLRAVIVERDDAIDSRERWRSTAKVVAGQRDQATRERDEARRELSRTRRERDAARADLAQARLDLLDPTLEPRPFRVGDRVRVAEGATWMHDIRGPQESQMSGRQGVVHEVYLNGDLYLRVAGGFTNGVASPEFCTLIEDEPFDYPAAIEQATADLAVEPRTLTITVPAGVAIEWSIR